MALGRTASLALIAFCEVAALAVWFFASAVVPVLVDTVGWKYAFAFLAPGPALGIYATTTLRGHPDSVRLANGNR